MRMERNAPPLMWPRGLAAMTVPSARESLAITVWPLTTTSSATVALNAWPGVEILEPRSWSRRTRMRVPAGRSMEAGGGGVCEALVPGEPGIELLACCVEDLHPASERTET